MFCLLSKYSFLGISHHGVCRRPRYYDSVNILLEFRQYLLIYAVQQTFVFKLNGASDVLILFVYTEPSHI